MDETSAVQLTFTIHAPELLVGFSEAASALYDSNWLAQRSDQELEQLVTQGRDDLAGRFTLRLDDGEPVDLAAKLTFENPDAIRNGGARGLPPGCLEAFLEFSAPEGTHRLRLDHARNSGKRLLLVDDDMRNIYALSAQLEELGFDISLANNGREALDTLERDPGFDIVLMDIMMPEMDGYEAMGRIRQQPRFTTLPILALTAKAMKDDRAKCLDAGANDYCSKPIDMSKLTSLMRVWLHK